MTAYYKARFIASINNVNLKKNFAQQELYLVIVAQKGSTNQQEFAVTLLKEGNAESASFIGTSVMTVEGFDRLKKAYNLDCKFEDFPKLVAHVIDSLEVTKKNFVHVHIVEDCCSVNFVKSDEWNFMLNFKVVSSDVVGYLLEVVQNLQIRVDQEDFQMQNLQKQMEQTQILSNEKPAPVQVNPEMSPTRSEIGSNNMRNSFNGQCVETDQNQGYVDLTKLHEIPLNNKQQQQYSRITPPQSSSYNNFVPPQHMPTFTNPGQQQSMVPPPTSAPFHNPFTYGPGLASSHILRKPHPLPHNYSTVPSQMPTNSTFSHNPAQLIPQLVSGQSTPLTTYPNMSYS